MKTYHNDVAVKARLISQLEAHAKADEIVKGQYWRGGKGCAVGCTVHSGDHNLYPETLGLPVWLAHLEDKIFEGLPNAEAKAFPIAFARAIPVGVDLEPVRHKFLCWLMEDNLQRVESLDISSALKAQITTAIVTVRDLHAAESMDGSAWKRARVAARVAARGAAWAWASREAAEAAEAAAEAAWAAAAWEAAEAAWAWAARAWVEAEASAWLRYRDELLRLLASAR